MKVSVKCLIVLFCVTAFGLVLAGCGKTEQEKGTAEKEKRASLHAAALRHLPSSVILSTDYAKVPEKIIPLPEKYRISFKTSVPLSITFKEGKHQYFLQMPEGDIYQVDGDDYGQPLATVKLPDGRRIQVELDDIYVSNDPYNHPVKKVAGFGGDHGCSLYSAENNFIHEKTYPGSGHYSLKDYQDARLGYYLMGKIILRSERIAKISLQYQSPAE